MSYMPGLGRAMSDYLEESAAGEELDLPKGEFVARMGKAYKIALTIAAVLSLAIGIPNTFIFNEDVGIIFMVLGVATLLILPTFLSYRCVINKNIIVESYFIVFIKRKKEVLWNDVKYKKIRLGNNNSIKLYDENKKLLISFDGAVVGFRRILKLANRSAIKK